ncbi:DUF6691 family protein [Thalassospira alkalitolerans]|uniref:Transporter n=1 Tax=Thalassospira alkalitolerans TaxID=1293890 RepID=A0A1Y2LGF7_9PROT|nr:DUF6691 family protein [Thalassospira alkalitolerans]OSQ50297.1 transporter [Thalassospira alkalitolerans]|tara:strand:+ start:5334 stop:5783 length:450 start_codon:yes stop_codon:yes gene_type:complete
MRILASLFCGLIFGAGLLISGMIDPQKVLGFLDIAAIANGGWDPSLAFVMAGGLIIAFPIFHFARSQRTAMCGGEIAFPTRRDIDRDLVIGGLLFGIGWGMVGYCPGPAISALAFGQTETFIFVLAMIGGMIIHRFVIPTSVRSPRLSR